jgi:hypothetical protein
VSDKPSPSRQSSTATTDSVLSPISKLEDPSSPISTTTSATTGKAPKKTKLTFPASDIVSVRKRGIGFTSRFAISYLSGLDGVGSTGLEITIRREWGEKEVHKFGSIVRRDELFRRLIAIGEQRWETM